VADALLSALTAADDADDADLVYMVKGGADRKATVAQVRASTIAHVSGLQAALDLKATVASAGAAIAVSKLAALTASRLPVLDGSGFLTASAVTAAEAGHLAGVTSAIQTQLNTLASDLATNQTNDRARANHTGSQLAATISDFATAADARIAAASVNALADVTITAGADGDYLRHNGTAWVDAPLSAADINAALTYTAANAAALNASNLSTGTIPDGRFPAVLPAISGANLTNLPGGISGLTADFLPVATGAAAIGNSLFVQAGDATNPMLGTGTTNAHPAWRRVGTRWNAVLGDNSGLAPILASEVYAGAATAAGALFAATGGAAYFVKGDLSGYADVGGANFRAGGSSQYYFYPGDPFSGFPDCGFGRSAVGVVKVTDGSTGYGTARAAAHEVATANGALGSLRTISESISLSTGGATTDSSTKLLPANAFLLATTYRITASVTGVDSNALQFGDATTPARFGSTATLTAGTTGVLYSHLQGSIVSDATGPVQVAAAQMRLTLAGGADNTPTGGVVRVTQHYFDFTPPTS
jgi:hypothetical protein